MSILCMLKLCLSIWLASKFFVFYTANAKNATIKKFPAEILRCHYGDTECVVRTSTSLVHTHARTGYPAAGFPPVEPIHVKRIEITDSHGGSLNLKLLFRDVDVLGLSGVNFQRAVGFTKDPFTSKFEMYGEFPRIGIRGKYTADGRVLILPIRGDGDADINLEKPKFSVKFKPSITTRNGKHFLTIDKLKVLLEPKRVTVKFTNLFNGDDALNTHMNTFLNENWLTVWVEIQPSVHAAIADIMKSILNPVFKQFAYDDIYQV